MTPAAKAAIATARLQAQALTPRINNALIKAGNGSQPDAMRLEHLQDAKAKAVTLLQLIQIAEIALTIHRRQGGGE